MYAADVRAVTVQLAESPAVVTPTPHCTEPFTLISDPSRNSSIPNTRCTSVADGSPHAASKRVRVMSWLIVTSPCAKSVNCGRPTTAPEYIGPCTDLTTNSSPNPSKVPAALCGHRPSFGGVHVDVVFGARLTSVLGADSDDSAEEPPTDAGTPA